MVEGEATVNWKEHEDATMIRPPEAAKMLGVTRERATGLARDREVDGKRRPGYLIPDQAVPTQNSGVVRFFRRDYVRAIARLRDLFDPHDPARGAMYWAAWVEEQIGYKSTPWWQFYGVRMADEDNDWTEPDSPAVV